MLGNPRLLTVGGAHVRRAVLAREAVPREVACEALPHPAVEAELVRVGKDGRVLGGAVLGGRGPAEVAAVLTWGAPRVQRLLTGVARVEEEGARARQAEGRGEEADGEEPLLREPDERKAVEALLRKLHVGHEVSAAVPTPRLVGQEEMAVESAKRPRAHLPREHADLLPGDAARVGTRREAETPTRLRDKLVVPARGVPAVSSPSSCGGKARRRGQWSRIVRGPAALARVPKHAEESAAELLPRRVTQPGVGEPIKPEHGAAAEPTLVWVPAARKGRAFTRHMR